MIGAFLWLFNAVISLIIFLVFVWVILSWLIGFNVVNIRNPFVRQLSDFLDAVTTPLLAPIRRIVPLLGGFDISPIILFFFLQFIQILVNNVVLGRSLLSS